MEKPDEQMEGAVMEPPDGVDEAREVLEDHSAEAETDPDPGDTE